MTRRLRVVEGLGDAVAVKARTPGLAARPFRPGELPRRLLVDLGTVAGACAGSGAARDGLPLGLWVRIAVEAARHLRVASTLADLDRAALAAAIDARAGEPAESVVVEARELNAYARALARGGDPPVGANHDAVAIDVSDEIALSWRQAALADDCGVNEWASRMLIEAPAGAVAWEAAAARSAMTLGELVYANALELAAASSA